MKTLLFILFLFSTEILPQDSYLLHNYRFNNDFEKSGIGTDSFMVKSNYPILYDKDTNWLKIEAGEFSSIALKKDGTLWMIGPKMYIDSSIYYKRMGFEFNFLPYQIGNDNDWNDIYYFENLYNSIDFLNFGLKKNGTIWYWGQGVFNNSFEMKDSFQIVIEPKLFTKSDDWIKLRYSYKIGLFGIKKDGSVWIWPTENEHEFSENQYPIKINNLENVQDLHYTNYTSSIFREKQLKVIKNDGSLWWHPNLYDLHKDIEPDLISYNENNKYSEFVIYNHLNWAFLKDSNSQIQYENEYLHILKDNTHKKIDYKFKYNPDLKELIIIYDYIGLPHIVEFTSDSLIIVSGLNDVGVLGNESYEYFTIRDTIKNKWVDISYFYNSKFRFFAISDKGQLWTWGNYKTPEMSQKSTSQILIDNSNNWKSIHENKEYVIALKKDGTIWSWGRNDIGQLGLGDLKDRFVPHQIGTDNDWVFICTPSQSNFNLAIKRDGTLWAWGQLYDIFNYEYDFYNKYKNDELFFKNYPTLIDTIKNLNPNEIYSASAFDYGYLNFYILNEDNLVHYLFNYFYEFKDSLNNPYPEPKFIRAFEKIEHEKGNIISIFNISNGFFRFLSITSDNYVINNGFYNGKNEFFIDTIGIISDINKNNPNLIYWRYDANQVYFNFNNELYYYSNLKQYKLDTTTNWRFISFSPNIGLSLDNILYKFEIKQDDFTDRYYIEKTKIDDNDDYLYYSYNFSIRSLKDAERYTLNGRIVDEFYNGVTNIKVACNNDTISTDASGYYQFERLIKGDYKVNPVTKCNSYIPSQLVVNVEGDVSDVDFVYEKIEDCFKIEGRVAFKDTPFDNIPVFVNDTVVYTDKSGRYELEYIRKGKYRIFPVIDGYYSNPAYYDLEINKDYSDLDFSLKFVQDYKEDENQTQFFIYPNPIKDNTLLLQINTLEEEDQYIEVDLLDYTGRKKSNLYKGIFVNGYQEFSFNLNSFSEGLYFISIKHNNKTTIKKIIK